MNVIAIIIIVACYIYMGAISLFIIQEADSAETKLQFLTHTLKILGWPLVWLYGLIIILPTRFYKYWTTLPDEQKSTE
jgi:hypothetical protein